MSEPEPKPFRTDEQLPELCRCYGPPGLEDEVANFCRPWLERTCDRVWQDEVGNLVGFIEGRSESPDDSVRIFAHMDEIALIVKRIEEDGTIRVDPLGGIYPNLLGVGPVEILGRRGPLPGVLGAGSVHVSESASGAFDIQSSLGKQAMTWADTHVFTGLARTELYEKGVRAGTRIVVPRARRTFTELAHHWAGYFLDDRMAIAVLLSLAEELKQGGTRPFPDLYLVLTVEEEIGAHGAKFAARTIPATLTLGLEVGPAEREYSIDFNDSPILVYRDEMAVYDRRVADHFLDLADEIGQHVQTATLSSYKSDVSHAKSAGQSPFSGLICLPTMNTHGYEIVHKNAIPNTERLLRAFLMQDSSSLLQRYSAERSMVPV